jgi:hypothetical protein
MTLEQIKKAVNDGLTVYADSTAYIVILSKFGEYMIKCTLNGRCIGLDWTDDNGNVKLNASNFFCTNTTAMQYYFYNHNDDYISFDALAEATKYAKENYPWVLKIRDNMGGEYFI